MKNATFLETVQTRNKLLNEQAVWKELANYLTKFLDSDTGPATVGIQVEGNIPVTQEVITAVQSNIHEMLADIDKQIKQLEELRVTENAKVVPITPGPEGTKETKKKRVSKAQGTGNGE